MEKQKNRENYTWTYFYLFYLIRRRRPVCGSEKGGDEVVEEVDGVHHGLGGLEDLAVERGLDVLLEME